MSRELNLNNNQLVRNNTVSNVSTNSLSPTQIVASNISQYDGLNTYMDGLRGGAEGNIPNGANYSFNNIINSLGPTQEEPTPLSESMEMWESALPYLDSAEDMYLDTLENNEDSIPMYNDENIDALLPTFPTPKKSKGGAKGRGKGRDDEDDGLRGKKGKPPDHAKAHGLRRQLDGSNTRNNTGVTPTTTTKGTSTTSLSSLVTSLERSYGYNDALTYYNVRDVASETTIFGSNAFKRNTSGTSLMNYFL